MFERLIPILDGVFAQTHPGPPPSPPSPTPTGTPTPAPKPTNPIGS